MSYNQYKFDLKPLAFPYDALKPHIDEETMHFHHDKHLQAYVDNLNAALANHPEFQKWPLEKLITDANWLPEEIRTAVRNNAGGVYNHNLYFENLSPSPTALTEGSPLETAILAQFGGLDNLKKELKAQGLGVFGSGWAFLTADCAGVLKIVKTANQDTTLTLGVTPVMILDVWEHAYYLKYKNKRADYIDAWFAVANMEKAEASYQQAIEKAD